MRRAPYRALRLAVALALAGASGAARAAAPDEVVRATQTLDDLTLARLDGWRQSPDLAKSGLDGEGNGPARPTYDDSRWVAYTLETRIPLDACWFRRTIVVPAFVAGRPAAGPAQLRIGVKEKGEVFVDGARRGQVEWSGVVPLSDSVKPGDRFVVAVRATNSGGSLMRLWSASVELTSADAAAARERVQDLALSLRVAHKLVGFDTYQTSARKKTDPGTDRSTVDPVEKRRLGALLQDLARSLDVDALARGDARRFDASVAALTKGIEPIADYARRFTLYFDANAHIDAAWLWRERETVQVCKNTFASVMNMFRARPDFIYTQSSAAYYDWIERLYPDLFAEIQSRAREGRWEVVGGMWVEPDCNLPSGESWARHLLYGKRYFRQKLGVDVKVGWNPDSFGYNASMPLLYRQAGIDAFITQKIGWNSDTVFPYRVFFWESPDGSRVLSYFPFDYVNEVDDPFKLVDWLRQFEANTGFMKLLVLFGVGDHGGGPSLEMLARVDRLKKLLVYPSIEHGAAGSYLSWLHSQDLAAVPTWRDELYLEYHQGTYTTQAATKEQNRRAEVLLGEAETFSTLATGAGRPYASRELEGAWRDVMFNQFHDILPGSSIHEVYADAPVRYRAASEVAQHELDGSLATLAAQVDTRAARGTPVLVFNPLAWTRSDPVRVKLPRGDWAVFNAAGAEMPSQQLEAGRYDVEVLFIARDVPALGHALFDVRQEKPRARGATLEATPDRLESPLFRVAVDGATGTLRSLVDKRTGRELLAGPGNDLQVLEDKPDAWDAWNIGLTGVRFPTTLRKVEVVERGPVRAVVRVTRDYLKPGSKKDFPTEDFPSSFFTEDVVLWDGLDRVDFALSADWWEEKTMLKVAFPMAVEAPFATYDIPFGTIRRSTGDTTPAEKAQIEVPALRWADLSQDDFGVSLLSASKYGFDTKGHTIRLSLLRSPKWPDPLADRGRHEIAYALYPHAGRWSDADTTRRGIEYNTPLLAVTTTKHAGTAGARAPDVTLAPANLVLTTLKRAEDGDAWIVRWYDGAGRDSVASLALPKAPRSAVRSSFLEDDGEALTVKGNTVEVPTGHHGVVTVKVRF